MKRWILLMLLGTSAFACAVDELPNPLDVELQRTLEKVSQSGDLSFFLLPEGDDLSAIPQGVGNPLTRQKVKLGKMLFFETGLARESVYEEGKGTYSCATCHVPTAGFMPGSKQGIADGGRGFGLNGESREQMNSYDETELDVQGARPLSLLNVAYVTNTTWSGKFGAHYANANTEDYWGEDPATEVNRLGYDGLESQNMEGLALHRMVVDNYVLDTLGYRALYDAAFSDLPETERYGKVTTSFAISAYIRTLITNKAPFQEWLRGKEDALSEREKHGAVLFYSKAGCYRCHKGPAMSSVEFHALGVKDLYEAGGLNTSINDLRNLGRGGFTGEPEDLYKFKVPGIYNMQESPFYFHGSSKHSLREVVEYFNQAEPENANVPREQLSPFFHPLRLTEAEIDDLVQFLENGLRDPLLQRYVPDFVLSGNCFPNNDSTSQDELGCN